MLPAHACLNQSRNLPGDFDDARKHASQCTWAGRLGRRVETQDDETLYGMENDESRLLCDFPSIRNLKTKIVGCASKRIKKIDARIMAI